MTRCVLVTRPEPGATETARRLETMGFVPVRLPLTEIVPVPSQDLPDPAAFDAVIATSVNALRCAPPELLSRLGEKPLFAVGDATAAEARLAGFGNVRSASGTAADLALLIAREMAQGARLLHLAGVKRTPGFAQEMERKGFSLHVAEIYDAQKISYATDFLLERVANSDIWGALVLSTRAGELLAELAAREGILQRFEKTLFFCISQKAATPLREIAAGRTMVSGEPTEPSVLRLLSSQG